MFNKGYSNDVGGKNLIEVLSVKRFSSSCGGA